MKRNCAFLLVLLAVSFPALAQDRGGDMGRSYGNGSGGSNGGGKPAGQASRPAPVAHSAPAPVSRPAPARNFNPVHIDLSHPGSGANNRNFNTQSRPQPQREPSYGQAQNWSAPRTVNQAPDNRTYGVQIHAYQGQQQNIRAFSPAGTQTAAAVHHHAYTAGYVRKKLQKIGVKKEPGYITDRQEIVDTDRAHSVVLPPQTGPQGTRLNAAVVSARHYNDPVVRNQMKLVAQSAMRQRVTQYNQLETQQNHYYWHNDNGFNYCHYVDNWGYHWYGWYVGDQYFWTRNYANRWWWYDTDYNRWCFWNAGFWWWQDPDHLGDLYCYNNDAYIPTNSAEDQIVVTTDASSAGTVFTSPDGTRQVKVLSDSQDAFLYDTADPPSFAPIYLASKVTNVQFSSNSGRPLEIVLTLGDGTFDLFDDQGNPYNPGAYDADQDAQSQDNGTDAPQPPSAPPDPQQSN
jgi:hypothetical protein